MKTIFKVFLSQVSTMTFSFTILTILAFSLTTVAQNRTGSRLDISLSGGSLQSSQINIEGDVLYDQTFAIGGEGEALNSQQNDPPWTDFDCQGADDFVVPELEIWAITDVVAIGEYYNGPGPALDFDIYFYADDAGVPGAEIIALLDQAYTDNGQGAFLVSLSEVVELQPGKYWVSVVVYIEIAVGGQWSWYTHLGPIFDPAVWRNPPDGYGTGFTAWTPIQSVFPGYLQSDFAYALLGSSNIVSVEDEVNSPLTFSLDQNYPNPFNPSTNIKYSVPENGFIKLSIYNIVGEEVSVLINQEVAAGLYEVTFNATYLSSGTYFYRLQTGNFVETKKMVLLR